MEAQGLRAPARAAARALAGGGVVGFGEDEAFLKHGVERKREARGLARAGKQLAGEVRFVRLRAQRRAGGEAEARVEGERREKNPGFKLHAAPPWLNRSER